MPDWLGRFRRPRARILKKSSPSVYRKRSHPAMPASRANVNPGFNALVYRCIRDRTYWHLAPPMYSTCGAEMPMRVAQAIVLSEEERAELSALVRSKRTSVRLAQRAHIVLLASDGKQNKNIAEQLGIGRVQVARWRERYAQWRLAGIERDLPRGAPPKKVNVARLVELTTRGRPKAATQWSTRTMANELGVSAASISRHWRAHGLKPHVVRGFKISRDPKFAEKLEDIVALYMSPPEHALVLCCDEKSQVQALDRTQPGLP